MTKVKRSIVGSSVFVALCVVAAFVSGSAGAVRSAAAGASLPANAADSVYLVLLEEPPAGAYEGGIAGLEATKPGPGERFDRNDPAVRGYVRHLRSRRNDAANRVGAVRLYDYDYSLNGFAAPLNNTQVAALRSTAGVVSVTRDSMSQPTTDNTPDFLGLTDSGGLWDQLGGQGSAGEDVVIGVIDTGIWPEHPSFADTNYGPAPAGWNGTCQSGQRWSKQHCTDKLIGARYFHRGFGHAFGSLAGDYQSARDHDGHGTHTASTAGGNANVTATVFGQNRGTVSGMAPRARIAAYKACWPGGCAVSDLVAAIDAAVGDGVDVINYSIGDGDPDFLDADDVAFLFARQANVFVAASAGNAGPDASTVDHGGPWLTTVGASTQNRSFRGTATMEGGGTFGGVSITPGLAMTAVVDGAAAGSEGCLDGLNPALVTGKIVVCKGSFSRAARSRAVKQAGGAGMILYAETDTDALLSDNHHVPTLHVSFSDGQTIKAYIAGTASPRASLSGGSAEFGGGNTMAAFSSRGPLLPNERSTADTLKPDVTAPGVQILAGTTPTATVGAPGQLFQAIAGTSMSSPHVAGLGALLRDLHPAWTPDLMQSALMTTARQDLATQDGVTPAGPFDFGAGHVVPNRAADPGLVFPATFDDYRAFLKSQGLCNLCFSTSPAAVVAPSDLNLPTVTIGALVGVEAVTRTVRNVGGAASVYTASVEAPPGVDVTVTPNVLTLAPDGSETYQISFAVNGDADFIGYEFGSLTWSDAAGHQVRSPLVVKPVQVDAPSAITGTGTSGSEVFNVTFGYAGDFTAVPQGLVPATTETRTVVDDPTNNFDTDDPDANQGIQVHPFTIASGTTLTRLALFDEFTDGEDDLDIFLYRVDPGEVLTLVDLSAGGTSAERIELVGPDPGDYRLYVHGWQTDGTDAEYTLFRWSVPSSPAGNMTVATSTPTATVRGSAEITVTWSSLTAGTKYLGRVSYSNGIGEIGSTVVNIAG